MRKNNLFYILIISTFFAVLLFNPNLRPNVWDSYEYLNVGKSLAQGKGNLQIWHPEEPTDWRSVGYPYLLSVLMHISDNIIFLKCFSLVCYIANIILIYYLFLKIFRLPDIIIFILSLIINLNLTTITLSHSIMSDPPFLTMLILSLISITKYIDHDKNINIYILLVPLFMICSWQIRSLGLTIILAIFFYLFVEKYFKKLVYLTLFTAPILFALYFNNNNEAAIIDNYNFLSTLMNTIYHPQAFAQLIFDGFSDYFYFIPRSLFGFFYDTIGHFNLHTIIFFKIVLFIFSLFIILSIILGYLKSFHSYSLIGILVAIYFVVLIVFPWNHERLIFPLFPFLLLYFYNGLQVIVNKLFRKINEEKKYFITIGICLTMLFGSVGEKFYRGLVKNENIVALYKNGLASYPIEWQNYFNVLLWLKTNIPDNSIILTRDSSLCFLISGHKSVSLENAKGINDVNRLINFPNVDYAIANPYYKNTHEKFLFDVIRHNSDKFLQIYGKNDDSVRVFKIIKSS